MAAEVRAGIERETARGCVGLLPSFSLRYEDECWLIYHFPKE